MNDEADSGQHSVDVSAEGGGGAEAATEKEVRETDPSPPPQTPRAPLLPPPPEWDSPDGGVPELSNIPSPYSSATSEPQEASESHYSPPAVLPPPGDAAAAASQGTVTASAEVRDQRGTTASSATSTERSLRVLLDRSEEQLARSREREKALLEQIDVIGRDEEGAAAQLSQAREKAEQAEDDMIELRIQVEALEEMLEEAAEAYDKAQLAKEGEMKSVKEMLAEAEIRAMDAQNQRDLLDRAVATLQSEVLGHVNEVSRAKLDRDEAVSSVKTAVAEYAILQEEALALKDAIEGYKADIAEANRQMQVAAKEQGEQIEMLEESRVAMMELGKEIAGLTADKRSLEDAVRGLEAALAAEKESTAFELEAADAAAKAAEIKCEEASRECAALSARLEACDEEVRGAKQARDEAAELRASLQEAQSMCRDAQNKCEELEEELKAIRQQQQREGQGAASGGGFLNMFSGKSLKAAEGRGEQEKVGFEGGAKSVFMALEDLDGPGAGSDGGTDCAGEDADGGASASASAIGEGCAGLSAEDIEKLLAEVASLRAEREAERRGRQLWRDQCVLEVRRELMKKEEKEEDKQASAAEIEEMLAVSEIGIMAIKKEMMNSHEKIAQLETDREYVTRELEEFKQTLRAAAEAEQQAMDVMRARLDDRDAKVALLEQEKEALRAETKAAINDMEAANFARMSLMRERDDSIRAGNTAIEQRDLALEQRDVAMR